MDFIVRNRESACCYVILRYILVLIKSCQWLIPYPVQTLPTCSSSNRFNIILQSTYSYQKWSLQLAFLHKN
jgi:hypothetical protein